MPWGDLWSFHFLRGSIHFEVQSFEYARWAEASVLRRSLLIADIVRADGKQKSDYRGKENHAVQKKQSLPGLLGDATPHEGRRARTRVPEGRQRKAKK